jgi:hypothetical protein
MSFKLSFFRVGDRVQNRDGGLGTVIGIGRKYLRVDWDDKSHAWPRGALRRDSATPIVGYITTIVDAADGRRSSS